MKNGSINALLERLDKSFGEGFIVQNRNSAEEVHGAYFRLNGIPVSVSVLTDDGRLPFGRYDIQIESVPPGDYVFCDEVALDEFVGLIERFTNPPDTWS